MGGASRRSPTPSNQNWVMVSVSAEAAIAIAVGSFAMGAAMTAALCYFLQYRRNSPKRLRSSRLSNGGVTDADDREDMAMIASPSKPQPPKVNRPQLPGSSIAAASGAAAVVTT